MSAGVSVFALVVQGPAPTGQCKEGQMTPSSETGWDIVVEP